MKRAPRRLQRKRTKGWRKPPGAICVDRTTKYGNPYRANDYNDGAAGAVSDYEDALRAGLLDVSVDDVRRELRGKDLLCWCAENAVCHADVLLRIAAESDVSARVEGTAPLRFGELELP